MLFFGKRVFKCQDNTLQDTAATQDIVKKMSVLATRNVDEIKVPYIAYGG
jgi:hypothetical protein